MAEHPRKRKQRGASPSPTPRERMEHGYARAEERNQEAREALAPLAGGERPPVVTVGAVVSALIAISIVVGYLAGNSYEVVASRIGTGGALVTATVVVAALVVWHVRRRRSQRASAGRPSPESEPDAVRGDEDVTGDARRRA